MTARYRTVAAAGLPRGRDSRVLDIGCGSGLMVYALHLAGVRSVVGVDPFTQDHSFGGGAEIRRSSLADVQGAWDLIMLHHSLEHVPDPVAEMRLVIERLAPGGRVLVRIPTVTGEAFERYGAAYYGLDAPRHVTMFSREGFRAMCERLGLRVRHVEDDGVAAQFWASEQLRLGIPYASERSYLVDPKASPFSRSQIRAWEKEAEQLNRAGRADQSIWVLEAV